MTSPIEKISVARTQYHHSQRTGEHVTLLAYKDSNEAYELMDDREPSFPRQDWRASEGNKVILVRPAGERLDITGQRMDGPAPLVHIGAGDFVSDYPGSTFEVIGLTFPSEGCWEMTAKTGNDELRFTTTVSSGRADP